MYNIYARWCTMIKNLLTYLISSNLRSVMNEPAVILTLLNLLIFWVQVQLTFGRDGTASVPPSRVDRTQ